MIRAVSLFFTGVVLLAAGGTTSFAQSTVKHDFSLMEVQLPLKLFPPEMKTLTPHLITNGIPIIEVKGWEGLGGALQTRQYDNNGRVRMEDKTEYYLKNRMFIDGLERVDEGGDVIYEIEIGNTGFSNVRLMNDRIILDGSNRTDYYHTMTFDMEATLRILRASDGAVFIERPIGVSGKTLEHSGRGVVLDTPFKANEYFNADKENFTYEVISSELPDLFRRAVRAANNEFGYLDYPVAVRLFSFKKRKYDYSDLDRAVRSVEESNELRTQDPLGEAWRAPMEEAVQIWRAALEEADFSNKKARINEKVGRHVQYNLAVGLIWLRDFDEVDALLADAEKSRGPKNRVKDLRKRLKVARYRVEEYAKALEFGPYIALPPLKPEAPDRSNAVRFFTRSIEDWQVEGFRDSVSQQMTHAVLWTRFQSEGEGRASRGRLKVEIPWGGEQMRLCFAHRDNDWRQSSSAITGLEIDVPFVDTFGFGTEVDGMEVCSDAPANDIVAGILMGWNNGDVQIATNGGPKPFTASQSLQGFPLALMTADILMSGETPAPPEQLAKTEAYQKILTGIP